MSAFIVQKRTIDAIVTYVQGKTHHDFKSFGVMGYTCEELGQALWDLNHEAVNYRYRESDKAPAYVWDYVNLGSIPALYKAVSCLLYQCSEGDCPERPAYKGLVRLQRTLADRFISDFPEHKNAAWG